MRVVQSIVPDAGEWRINRSGLPEKYAVLIRAGSGTAMIRTQLLDPTKSKTREDGSYYQRDDRAAPYTLGGGKYDYIAPLSLGYPTYSLKVFAYNSAMTNTDRYDLTLTMVDSATAAPAPVPNPEPEPAPAPAPAPEPTPEPVPAPEPAPAPSTGDLGPLRIFPGAGDIFGASGVAGRGGKICRVTTLLDSGEPGSLRYCVGLSGPRVVVFDVGGVIKLNSTLTISRPNITIAGQTAPSPGITLYGNTTRVTAGEVLVQHIRFRVGDKSGTRDAIETVYATSRDSDGDRLCDKTPIRNVVFDHVTIGWAVDGSFDVQPLGCPGKISDVSLVNSVVAEHLDESVHSKGRHSFAMLVAHGARNIGVYRNIFAHNYARNPRLDSNVTANVINNYQFDLIWHAVEVRNASTTGELPTTANVVGNLYESKAGGERAPFMHVKSRPGYVNRSIFLQDNLRPQGNPLIKAEKPDSAPSGERAITIDDIVAKVPPIRLPAAMPASQVRDTLLRSAGARPADRDRVDTRLFADLANRRGAPIDKPDAGEVSYLESLAKPESATRRSFAAPSDPWGDSDGDGWSNLEEALYAAHLKVTGS